jgi:hypothetical protein
VRNVILAAAVPIAAIAVAVPMSLARASSPSPAAHVAAKSVAPGPSSQVVPGLPADARPFPGARPFEASRPLASTLLQSTTWAGYVANGPRFRFVKATFRLPRLNCRKTPGTVKAPAMFADWVGLDGFGGGHTTVEQEGVYGQCERGAPSYGAWWEVFPKAPVYPFMTVRPGDVISVSTYYNQGKHAYQLVLTDQTNGEGFSTWRRCGSSYCLNNSAEVITEQPAAGTSTSVHYPLADFGSTSFWNISVTDMAGQRGGYGSSHWQSNQVLMVDNGNHTMVGTGGLGGGGTAFQTRWFRQT